MVCSFHLPPAAAQFASQPQTVATDQTSVEELAALKHNPVSGLRQIVLQAVVSPDMPISRKTDGNYSIQPVWPFALGENWRLITYTILPVVQLPGAPSEHLFHWAEASFCRWEASGGLRSDYRLLLWRRK
jgi:hypothetical protein